MSELTLQSQICRVDEPVFSRVDDDLIMLSHERGKYFHLNSFAACIWELIDRPISVADICRKIEARYDVGGEDVQADVLEFLRELESRTLIEFRA